MPLGQRERRGAIRCGPVEALVIVGMASAAASVAGAHGLLVNVEA